MFDFPQPGEIYRCTGFPDVVVVGVLVPLAFRGICPTVARNCSGTRTAGRTVFLSV